MTVVYGAPGGDPPVSDQRWMRGEVLDGDYRIERLLGEGGMGMVVAARHVRTGEQVAIKLIRRERVTDPAFLKRFMREATIALQLRGAHVAPVLRIGFLPSGLPYLVMEYLEGETLQAVLIERGPLPVDVAVDYLLEACDAVAEAHAAGIAHRDLKPGNLFLTRTADGGTRVKVIDFGISKWISSGASASSGPHVTTTTVPIGSPAYMSPEQLSEVALADPRSDVWALGVILFELVTGNIPFSADSIPAVQVAVLRDEAPSLRSLMPSAPAALDAVYQRCLIKDRAARMASVHDLVVALAPFASARGRALAQEIVARTPRAATTIPGDGAAPSTPSVTAGARRPWYPRALIVGAVVVVGVGVGWQALRGRATRHSLPPPSVATTVVPPPAVPPIAPPAPTAPAAAKPGATHVYVRASTASTDRPHRHASPRQRTGGASSETPPPGGEDELFSTRR